MTGKSPPIGIVFLPEKPFLELFSYGQWKEGNEALLDIENRTSNLLRARNAQTPVVYHSLQSFEQFRREFVEPIEESRGAQSLGLAFRGQPADFPLHSRLKRFWNQFPEQPLRDGMPLHPRREADYRMTDVNEVVKKHLFQFGAVPLPCRDHLYGVLQHYGAPTPLLDWTLRLDIALFFALEHASKDHDRVALCMADIGKIHAVNLRAIYGNDAILDIGRLREVDPTKLDETWTFLRPASFGDIRFSVQQGIFAKQQFDTEHAMIALDEFLKSPSPQYACRENVAWKQPCRKSAQIPGTLWVVTLPAAERPKVMAYLAERNVTRESLFVSWEYICKDLVSQATDRLLSGSPLPGFWHHFSPQDIDGLLERKGMTETD